MTPEDFAATIRQMEATMAAQREANLKAIEAAQVAVERRLAEVRSQIHRAESRGIRSTCLHTDVVPVESGGEVVAHLCLTCDEQLP